MSSTDVVQKARTANIKTLVWELKQDDKYELLGKLLDEYFKSDQCKELPKSIERLERSLSSVKFLQSSIFDVEENCEILRKKNEDLDQFLVFNAFEHTGKFEGWIQEKES